MVDYWRQLDVFSPEKFGDKPVHFIGGGATGSFASFITADFFMPLLAAKMGVPKIHVWDYDTVEDHNVPNQIMGPGDVNEKSPVPKVDALREHILRLTGIEIVAHNKRVTGGTELSGIVFLLVDSMDVRKEIWDGAIKMNPNVDLMVETRMAIDGGYIYTIKPTDLDDVRFWEAAWYPDSEAEESPCTSRAISPTVAMIAAHAVWKLIKFANGLEYQRELLISAQPAAIYGSEMLARK